MKYFIPPVGTQIPVKRHDLVLSKDYKTFICRIIYDETTSQWKVSVNKAIGLLVFLNDSLEKDFTHIQINAVQKSGRAVWARSIIKLVPRK